MSTAINAAPGESKARTVFRAVSGNFLEMYDFMVYGYYAAAIASTF
ncbi:MAG: MFS transporter, partial [Paraburkholderia sp.]|nr:MFS transporter [Paraburkholderia sp.]